MKRLREFKGLPVLTLEEGEQLGRVRDLLIDPDLGQAVALVLDRRSAGREWQVVATANVRKVGPAAITVENRSSLVPLSRIPRFQQLARKGKPVRGKTVVTEGGARLGQVADLLLDPETFRIEGILLRRWFGRGRMIPAEQIRTLGADAIVVREEAPLPRLVPAAPAEPGEGPQPEPAPTAPVPEAAPAEAVPELEVEPPVPPLSAVEEAVAESGKVGAPEEAPAAVAEEVLGPASAEEAPPAEEAPADEAGENPWQRWVRRLLKGGQEDEEEPPEGSL